MAPNLLQGEPVDTARGEPFVPESRGLGEVPAGRGDRTNGEILNNAFPNYGDVTRIGVRPEP